MTKEEFISSEPSFIARMMADYVEYYLSHNRDYPQSFSYYIESLPGEAVEITFYSEDCGKKSIVITRERFQESSL